MDPAVIALLEDGLEQNPEQHGVRLHLARLLLADGRDRDALDHASRVLQSQPTDMDALDLAAEAAAACGEHERAAGYQRIAEALGGGDSSEPETSAAEPEAPETELAEAEPPQTELPDAEASDDDDAMADDEGSQDTEELAKVLPMRLVPSTGGDADDTDDGDEVFERPTITLDDIAGLDQVKRRLELAFLAPLRNPELREMYGKSLKGGLLLYGPPGCGKTYIARALAGELGAGFLAVGLDQILDRWVGESEKHIHQLFERARRNAPCVLFFDELDALGRKRSLARHSSWLTTSVNQLLSELDGAVHDNEGVFVLAATNHPWDVDTALRRPGRLDRMVLVLPPDAPARRRLVELEIAKKPTQGIDVGWIAKRTDGFSGADLTHLIDSATELAMEDSLRTGRTRPVTHKDVKRALKSLKPSTGSWLELARNFALFANASGDYDDLAEYLRRLRMV